MECSYEKEFVRMYSDGPHRRILASSVIAGDKLADSREPSVIFL
jgi:hypothetical protein